MLKRRGVRNREIARELDVRKAARRNYASSLFFVGYEVTTGRSNVSFAALRKAAIGQMPHKEIVSGCTLAVHPMADRCGYAVYDANGGESEFVAEMWTFPSYCRPRLALLDTGAHFGVFSLVALPVAGCCRSLVECFSHVFVEASFLELYRGQALADEIIRFPNRRAGGLRELPLPPHRCLPSPEKTSHSL